MLPDNHVASAVDADAVPVGDQRPGGSKPGASFETLPARLARVVSAIGRRLAPTFQGRNLTQFDCDDEEEDAHLGDLDVPGPIGRQPMSADRLQRALDRFAVHKSDPEISLGDALCAACVDVLELPGVGISVQRLGGTPHTIGVSNAVMGELEEVERTLGEGPCVDAYKQGQPIAEPDLTDPAATRWVAFNAAALQTEARAAFGYPVQIGSVRLGALNLYAPWPGPLSDEQHLDAQVLAHVTAHVVLADLDSLAAPLVDEGPEVEADELEVHQATGMISVQLSISISDSFACLRALALAEDRPISAVAADVVARRRRLGP